MILIVTLVLLAAGYCVGRAREAAHLRALTQREERTSAVTAVTFVPAGWAVESSNIVLGSVVVSLDYYKRLVASLKGLVGGQLKSYEPLMERARREAVLRMKEQAITQGFSAVVNVRLETSRLASSHSGGEGTSGVEVLAFGTAVNLG